MVHSHRPRHFRASPSHACRLLLLPSPPAPVAAAPAAFNTAAASPVGLLPGGCGLPSALASARIACALPVATSAFCSARSSRAVSPERAVSSDHAHGADDDGPLLV
jgi:hypothetical protein